MVFTKNWYCNKDAHTAVAMGSVSGQIVLDFGLYTKRVYTKVVLMPLGGANLRGVIGEHPHVNSSYEWQNAWAFCLHPLLSLSK